MALDETEMEVIAIIKEMLQHRGQYIMEMRGGRAAVRDCHKNRHKNRHITDIIAIFGITVTKRPP